MVELTIIELGVGMANGMALALLCYGFGQLIKKKKSKGSPEKLHNPHV